jgi:gamma-glutamyltranspeptidase / glutathione hydrolase
MNTVHKYYLFVFFAFMIADPVQSWQEENQTWQARGLKSAIVCGCPEGAAAGMAILDAGGNAIDAAVASLLVQSVVEAQLFCFGSEAPMIVFDANRKCVEVVAGLGASPQLATADWFRENRKGVIQGRGDIANCVVPAFLDACITALDRYGTKTFTECAGPMLVVLRQRAEAPKEKVQELAGRRWRVANPDQWIAHHRNFLNLIERLVEAENAGKIDRRSGLWQVSERFYRGDIAREMDAWSRANGGLLRYSDLARHHTRIERPLTAEFAGHTICKCGVWTQGPYLLQTLRIIEAMDLPAAMEHGSADYVHAVTETMKLCLADRDAYFADPEFVEVPVSQLLSDEYIAMRRELVRMDAASMEQQAGDPWNMRPLLGIPPQDHKVTSGHSNDTSSCLVADQWGNVISVTPSGWGGVIAGETGIEMGSRMIGLTCWEDHPSQLVPGKRPRVTLTPTMVLRDGQPVFAVSVAGGDQQDQASIQVLLNRLVFDMTPDKAVRSPRFGTDHHINWFGHLPCQPGSLTLPDTFSADVHSALSAKGHQITKGRPAATAVALSIDPESGEKHAAGEQGRYAASR